MFLESLKRKIKRNRYLNKLLGPFFGFHRNQLMRRARQRDGLDDNKVVFSAFDYISYNDNPRYVSEMLHRMRPETDIVWLFKNVDEAKRKFQIPDYVRCVTAVSREGFEEMGRARVIVDNFNKRSYLKLDFRRQAYIQTWHGDRPFKKIGYDMGIVRGRMVEEKCALGIVGSDFGEKLFRSAFHYKGALLKAGAPRNDILLRDDPAEAAEIRRKLGIAPETKVLIFAPTFRDVARHNKQAERVPLDLEHVLDTFEAATNEKWICLVRAHYLSFGLNLKAESARLLNMSAYPEMAELLKISDALITDYSSCATDYVLTRRPIFLYQDDLEDYRQNNRALYYSIDDTPFWVTDTPEGLDRLIQACTPERARENCEAILAFYGTAESGHASEAVAQYIIDRLKSGGKE